MPKKTKPRGARQKKEEEKKREGGGGEADGLREALLSIGVDKGSVEKLLASRALDRIVVPIYWKDGLVSQSHPFWLSKLPDFLRSFGKEFPDGQVRWDPDYGEQDPQGSSSDAAVRVYFNYQEDDQGDHWSPKPTVIEEQSYQKMLKRYSYKGTDPVQAQTVLHGK